MDDVGTNKPIKRRDIGIAGTVIVVIDALSNFQSSQKVSTEISKLKENVQTSKVEREQFFVRKTEIHSLNAKLDKMSDQITNVADQVTSLKTFLKTKYGYSASYGEQCDEDSAEVEGTLSRFSSEMEEGC